VTTVADKETSAGRADGYPEVWLPDLTERERLVFEAGFMMGHTVAESSRQREVDALNWEADRLYAEVCRRVPAPIPETVSYAELCRRRGDLERAQRAELRAAKIRSEIP
jgi:hypothetical protein